MKKLIFFCFYNVLFQFSNAQVFNKNFIYGVNGHPFTQESYSGNVDMQIKLIKEIDNKYYRVDVPTNAEGFVTKKDEFLHLLRKLKNNKLKLLPVLVFDKNLYTLSSSKECYNAGYEYGKNFAAAYKSYFNYYEVGNEEGTNIIRSADVDGNTIDQYLLPKVEKIMPFFKGVCDAIKKENSKAKIIINEGWVHYGFFEYLKIYKVKYDIIGYHAYSDMGDIKNARKKFGNVIDTLYYKFRKEIWVTEMNLRNGLPIKSDPIADNWFLRNLNFLYNNKHVGAVFVYELLDQPAFDSPNSPYHNPSEAKYGLGAWKSKYTDIDKKHMFEVYRLFVKDHP